MRIRPLELSFSGMSFENRGSASGIAPLMMSCYDTVLREGRRSYAYCGLHHPFGEGVKCPERCFLEASSVVNWNVDCITWRVSQQTVWRNFGYFRAPRPCNQPTDRTAVGGEESDTFHLPKRRIVASWSFSTFVVYILQPASVRRSDAWGLLGCCFILAVSRREWKREAQDTYLKLKLRVWGQVARSLGAKRWANPTSCVLGLWTQTLFAPRLFQWKIRIGTTPYLRYHRLH